MHMLFEREREGETRRGVSRLRLGDLHGVGHVVRGEPACQQPGRAAFAQAGTDSSRAAEEEGGASDAGERGRARPTPIPIPRTRARVTHARSKGTHHPLRLHPRGGLSAP